MAVRPSLKHDNGEASKMVVEGIQQAAGSIILQNVYIKIAI